MGNGSATTIDATRQKVSAKNSRLGLCTSELYVRCMIRFLLVLEKADRTPRRGRSSSNVVQVFIRTSDRLVGFPPAAGRGGFGLGWFHPTHRDRNRGSAEGDKND